MSPKKKQYEPEVVKAMQRFEKILEAEKGKILKLKRVKIYIRGEKANGENKINIQLKTTAPVEKDMKIAKEKTSAMLLSIFNFADLTVDNIFISVGEP